MDLTAQWPYIEWTAAERLKHNQTSRHTSQYGTYIELIGAAGELAARRFLGLPEELHRYLDGGKDFCYRGMRFDVKATLWTSRLQFRFLQWPITKVLKSDVLLLTAVNIERKAAVVVGFALRHEIARAPINQTRDYPCHEIPVPELHKASELLSIQGIDDLFHSKTRPHSRYNSYQASAVA